MKHFLVYGSIDFQIFKCQLFALYAEEWSLAEATADQYWMKGIIVSTFFILSLQN